MSTRRVDQLPGRRTRAITRQVVVNPSKGKNNLVSASLIDDKEFSDSLNIQYDEGGVARKRDGYEQVYGDLTAAKGLGAYITESLSQIVTIDNGVFKYATTGSFTSVATVSFSTTAEVTFTQSLGKLYVWNGSEGGTEWDGTTLNRPGTMPRASFAMYYQSWHIASGVEGQANRLYISQQDNASAFTRTATTLHNSTEVPGATVFSGTTANFIDVRKNDGDRITALGRFQDSVIIFKERSIFQLTFDESNNPVVQPITNSTGCIGHKTVENVENDLYFLSREGVRVLGNEPNFFTAIRTNVLSIRIQSDIDSIRASAFNKCNAHYYENKYLLAVPTTSDSVNKTIVYDRRFQAWSVWDNFNANSFLQFPNEDNETDLLFLDDSGTKIYKVMAGTYNDDGEAIDAYFVTKAWDGRNPDILKYWVDIGLIFRRISGQVSATVYVDDGALLGTATLSQGTSNGMGILPLAMQTLGMGSGEEVEVTSFSDEPNRLVVNTNSRTTKLKIQNNRLNEGFVFLGYILAYYPYTHFNFDSSRKIYL